LEFVSQPTPRRLIGYQPHIPGKHTIYISEAIILDKRYYYGSIGEVSHPEMRFTGTSKWNLIIKSAILELTILKAPTTVTDRILSNPEVLVKDFQHKRKSDAISYVASIEYKVQETYLKLALIIMTI
jgi:hypothetical protein